METSEQAYFFGRKGTIITSEHLGWIIVDDTAETGGYYALLHDPSPQTTEAFDWWFEAETWIPKFIEDMNWQIEWTAAESPKT